MFFPFCCWRVSANFTIILLVFEEFPFFLRILAMAVIFVFHIYPLHHAPSGHYKIMPTMSGGCLCVCPRASIPLAPCPSFALLFAQTFLPCESLFHETHSPIIMTNPITHLSIPPHTHTDTTYHHHHLDCHHHLLPAHPPAWTQPSLNKCSPPSSTTTPSSDNETTTAPPNENHSSNNHNNNSPPRRQNWQPRRILGRHWTCF